MNLDLNVPHAVLIVQQTQIFSRWLRRLRDRPAVARINTRLDRIEEMGHFGDRRPVGDGVWELRIAGGPGYRLYYVRQGETVVVLLCGGDKDSQPRDIARAKGLAKALEE